MKKLVIISLIFLTGCSADITSIRPMIVTKIECNRNGIADYTIQNENCIVCDKIIISDSCDKYHIWDTLTLVKATKK